MPSFGMFETKFLVQDLETGEMREQEYDDKPVVIYLNEPMDRESIECPHCDGRGYTLLCECDMCYQGETVRFDCKMCSMSGKVRAKVKREYYIGYNAHKLEEGNYIEVY